MEIREWMSESVSKKKKWKWTALTLYEHKKNPSLELTAATVSVVFDKRNAGYALVFE